MQKLELKLIIAVILLAFFSGCSKEYKKNLQWSRKGSTAQKDSAAFFFYERGDYDKAAYLFEELQNAYRGQPRGKEVLYHYAYSKYNAGFYTLAAYYFEQYTKLYPNDEKAAECMFQVGYCYYLESAPHYLDQASTLKAIAQFQLFLNTFPRHEQTEKCNELMTELRERLAKKAFENANLYYKIENYRAAVTAFEVMVQEYPDSRYREEAQYLRFKAAVELADVSTSRKKKNRYLDAIEIYEEFVDRYPSSVFLKDAENTFGKAKKNLGKIMAEEAEL